MGYAIRCCVLCRSHHITTETERDRFVTATCRACGAIVRVEFDPPDDPDVRGRIEVLVEPASPATRTDGTNATPKKPRTIQ
jgi:hypothetical protein